VGLFDQLAQPASRPSANNPSTARRIVSSLPWTADNLGR
jgi:hypothetical protein